MNKEYKIQLDRLNDILNSYGVVVNRNDIAKSILDAGAIIPPVAIKQILYVYEKHKVPDHDRIIEVEVYAIRIDTAKNDKRFCVQEIRRDWRHNYMATFKWSSIGKTIFYTKEEAEQQMNKRKK